MKKIVTAILAIGTLAAHAALYDGRQAEVASIDPDDAVAAKMHEGTTGGIDHSLYARREKAALDGVAARMAALDKRCRALLK